VYSGFAEGPNPQLGFEPKSATPQEFEAFLSTEIRKWPPLLRAAGVKPE
jgi:hypothetical protein